MKFQTEATPNTAAAPTEENAVPLQCPHCQSRLDAPALLCPNCKQPLHLSQLSQASSPKVPRQSWRWLARPQTLMIIVATVAATLGVYGYVFIQQFSSGQFLAEGDRQITLGNQAAAIAAYQRAVQLNPKNSDALERLGWAEYSFSHDAEAITYFEQALALEPGRPMSAYGAGVVAYHLRDYRRAEHHLENAVVLNPQNAEVYEYLGLAEYRLDDYASALEHLEVALQLNPESGSAHYYLARAQAQQGESALAIEHFNQAESLGFDLAAVQAARGLAWLAQGNYQAAKDDLQKALAVSSGGDEALLALAQVDYHLGDYAAAEAQLAALEKRIAVTPFRPAYLALLGWSALRQGNAQQARDAFLSWSTAAPDNADAFNALGWATLAMQDCQTARQSFERAQQLADGDWLFTPSSLTAPNETPEAGLTITCLIATEPSP